MAKEIELRYVRSDRYHSSIVDNASALIISDQVGDRLTLLLSKLDATEVSEKALQADDGSIALIPETVIASTPIKSVEFAAEMRLDAAFTLLMTIKTALSKLSKEKLAKYNITPEVLKQGGISL